MPTWLIASVDNYRTATIYNDSSTPVIVLYSSAKANLFCPDPPREQLINQNTSKIIKVFKPADSDFSSFIITTILKEILFKRNQFELIVHNDDRNPGHLKFIDHLGEQRFPIK